MAWDEALLETAIAAGCPVMRFYGWQKPAATFGYFQRLADVERMTSVRPLIRRPTGGGLVLHGDDWTYSLIFPAGEAWYTLKAGESYRRMHEWIQAAFDRAGVSTELAASAVAEAPGQCFIGAEQFDLLLQGRKIAGAAQRRTRHGLLIQGSIQPPSAMMMRRSFEEAFCAVVPGSGTVEWVPLDVDEALRRRVRELTCSKYARTEYNARR
jgi:lipoate-protein ligase A